MCVSQFAQQARNGQPFRKAPSDWRASPISDAGAAAAADEIDRVNVRVAALGARVATYVAEVALTARTANKTISQRARTNRNEKQSLGIKFVAIAETTTKKKSQITKPDYANRCAHQT